MTTQETLLSLMSIPTSQFDGVCKTADGHYIAKVKGDLGYNAFLGKPAPVHNGPGRTQMLAIWARLTATERKAVLRMAAHPIDGFPIHLHRDFGVPREEG